MKRRKDDALVDYAASSRRWIDARVGTSRLAIALRAGAGLSMVAFYLIYAGSDVLVKVVGLLMAWVIAPDRAAMDREFPNLVHHSITFLFALIPLGPMGFFAWGAFVDPDGFLSRVGFLAIALAFGYCALAIIQHRRPPKPSRP